MKFGKTYPRGQFKYEGFVKAFEHTIPALDSYTKLLIHGDADADATGKTITVPTNFDSYTKLLLHLDNDVTDSATAKTVTNNNVTFSSTVYKMGSNSGVFNGTNAYLTVPDSADWYFGTGDFTIDCWFKANTMNDGDNYMLASQYSGPLWMWNISRGGSTYSMNFQSRNSVGVYIFDIGGALSGTLDGRWTHLAVVRYGSTMYLYENGVQIASGGILGGGGNHEDVADVLSIGRRSDGNYYLKGYIDEFRVSKGIARWTANFTSLSNPYGTVLQTTSQYKFSILSRSLEFDGSGDYLSLAHSSDWEFGSGDFTIDWWEYRNSTENNRPVAARDGTTSYVPWLLGHTSSGTASFYASSNGSSWDIAANPLGTIDFNVWNHFAVVRSGNDFYTFKNGTQTDNWTSSGTIIANSNALSIGKAQGSTDWFSGWISEFRISKGIARWTSDFVPSTDIYGGLLTNACITDLNGDIDEEYKLEVGVSNLVDNSFWVYLNNDTGANYGYQYLVGYGASWSITRNTAASGILIYSQNASRSSLTGLTIHAKSGYIRTAIHNSLWGARGSTPIVYLQNMSGYSWNNTTDNITSMRMNGTYNNGLGPGTYIALYKKVRK